MYVDQCINENVTPVSKTTYRYIFVTDFNFGFGSLKTDTCKVCDVGWEPMRNILQNSKKLLRNKKTIEKLLRAMKTPYI